MDYYWQHYCRQTDPAYYEDPEEFRPERWENVNETRNNFTWLPFGDGPRQCSGAHPKILENYWVTNFMLWMIAANIPTFQMVMGGYNLLGVKDG